MPERHTQVLVVGGSLVGLSTSVLLASNGVPHLVIESHRGTAIHPRAASFHQRTMEIFRSVGLQREVEDVAAQEFRQGGAIVAVESLGGKELAYFYRSYNDGVEGLSPTDRLFITQVGLEPVLRQRATGLGAEHLFGTDLVSFETRDDHVASVIRPHGGGPEEVIISDYLVAADGAHSAVREQLGIPMTGRGSFADCVTIYFKADVNHLMGDRNLSVVYVNHPELMGFFRFAITGDSGFLAVFATLGPDGARNTHVGEDISVQQCVELVRTALGSEPGLPVEIENIQRWSAMAATAGSFQSGRVFLAGDAAHVMRGHDLWRRAAAEAEESLGVAVTVQPIGRDVLPEPAEPAAVTAGGGWTGAALIRPDGVIAWKPGVPAAEAAGQLATVLAGLLSRGGS